MHGAASGGEGMGSFCADRPPRSSAALSQQRDGRGHGPAGGGLDWGKTAAETLR